MSEEPTLPLAVLARIFQLHYTNPNTKISKLALVCSAEYLRIFVKEAVLRSLDSKTRSGGNTSMLEKEDLEKIAAQGFSLGKSMANSQMILDFS
ncbi:MHF histone-fold complex subunit 1 [Neolecta irregularis DAH-3]|uniref:MHF histone-fold complex subunit 1 n=1 Tax=Neolecta irregularis (strain DAH-3) TaxID=1198029 RepID=A0A1U7LIP8_NEOID|nr:MHF histone-fold complex subunit 1 [Neolecta irregularis DAH-3]|eukprot:OLL22519.1 MHF histone-fold complex subunit 1 [Neolecta irregularis DAH-3]